MDEMNKPLPYYADWPVIQSAIATCSEQELQITSLLSQMTLEEKVGQMIQPELRGVSPDEMRKYKLGSFLNGGGSWPEENKHASAADWARVADSYWLACEEGFADRPFRIPLMWATDAVHGHNNAFGATLFPHNIGLGCARDPELIRRIGRITAIEVAATGLDWTFAPTVATPRDYRWGRVYEGYSEDPAIVYAYAGKVVDGLQGCASRLKDDHHVIATVKHWVGDGGTLNGVDRGVNVASEELLRNIHAPGYFSGLDAGAQVVMASFNSWDNAANYGLSDRDDYNFKLHGSHYMLTQVLKERMQFDGLIVSDWNGHSEVTDCGPGRATYVVNAGIDILMVTAREDWKAVYRNTIDEVRAGRIAMERIDDAVTRILRVKLRAGLWGKPQPSHRSLAAKTSLVGAAEHRAVAREAVRKSLVLLKNKGDLLPLARDQRVLLAGSGADDLQKQTGGWSLTWQGNENTQADLPGAATLRMVLSSSLKEQNLMFDPQASETDLNGVDVAIVVIGEDPYAEMVGDIKPWQTLEFAALKRSYAKDSEVIARLHQAGVKVITVLFSGRPLYLNEEINHSDAFVAAWLPGSEGAGIADLLFRDAQGKIQHDFQGRLSYSWPMKKRSTTVNCVPSHIPDYQCPDYEQSSLGEHAPLFPYGYGLSYKGDGQRSDYDLDCLPLDEDSRAGPNSTTPQHHLEVFGCQAVGDYALRIADDELWQGRDVSANNVSMLHGVEVEPVDYQHQQDARRVTFKGGLAAIYAQTPDQGSDDLRHYLKAGATLAFDWRSIALPQGPVFVSLYLERDQLVAVDIREQVAALTPGEWSTISLPLALFAEQGVNFGHINTPFVLSSNSELVFELGNIRWELP